MGLGWRKDWPTDLGGTDKWDSTGGRGFDGEEPVRPGGGADRGLVLEAEMLAAFTA